MTRISAVGFILALSIGFVAAASAPVSANDGAIADSPIITTPSLPNGTVGVQYNQTIQANGVTSVTYKVEEGVLPSGLNMSGDGVISGTPGAVGTYGFRVSANSENNSSSSVWFAITTLPNTETDSAPVIEPQNTTVENDSVVKDSAFIGASYDNSNANEIASAVQTSSPAPAVSNSTTVSNSRSFGKVPQTGVPDVFTVAGAMIFFTIVAAISWTYVFCAKSRRRNNG